MKKLAMTLLAGCAAATMAAPAFAQSYVITQREADVSARISDGVRDGELSYAQAAQLRAELRQIENLDARYSDDGMLGWENRDLNSRLNLLDSRLNYDLSMSRGDYDDFFNY